ncbi:hypothetical protein CW304_12980 [Bacillus sp. UFRGS-B20]|nr:hypothetical protein CW304_12980 [Bacillus sp. UFRGS-B20]
MIGMLDWIQLLLNLYEHSQFKVTVASFKIYFYGPIVVRYTMDEYRAVLQPTSCVPRMGYSKIE